MKISIPQTPKARKAFLVLGAALGIGVLAAVVAYGYLSRQLAEIEARAKGDTVQVLVAKRDLTSGTKLNSETVAIRNVPRDFAHSVAVRPDQFGRLNGQALAFPVKSGEMVLWGLVEGKRASTFSARVENGRRAMTVPVDEINSISGMLEPGDTIDLMVSIERKNKRHTFPLLQSVQVMATGQRAVDDTKSGERRSYSTVTLNTTPEQAHNIIVARESGKITALLRNPQDKQLMPVSDADMAALHDLQQAQGVSIDGGRQVPVLYGGSASKLTEVSTGMQRPRPSTPAAKESSSQMPANPAPPAGSSVPGRNPGTAVPQD